MMKRSPTKHSQVQDQDDSEDELESKGLREADLSKLPAHLFENLKKIKCTVGDEEGLTAEDLESVANGDGEVWIIQCPKYVDPSAVFSGKKVSLDEDDISILNTLSDSEDIDFDRILSNKQPREKTKSTYEALSLPSKEDVDSLITLVPDSEGNRRIVAASVSGCIIVRKSIEDIPLTELVPRKTGKKQLPPGLKCHHPIYGVDFSHAKDIDNKTDSDDEYYTKKSRKKKKSKSYDEPYGSPMKYKKSKVDDYAINGTYSFSNATSEECIESPKKKKKKRKKDEDTEYETQEETFVNPPEQLAANSYEDEELVTKKKKSKKRKRDRDEDNNNEEEYHLELNGEEISPPKPKKHKKNKSKHKSLEEMY